MAIIQESFLEQPTIFLHILFFLACSIYYAQSYIIMINIVSCLYDATNLLTNTNIKFECAIPFISLNLLVQYYLFVQRCRW
jgi:hypothetical protein